jgi:hypothetical protein
LLDAFWHPLTHSSKDGKTNRERYRLLIKLLFN